MSPLYLLAYSVITACTLQGAVASELSVDVTDVVREEPAIYEPTGYRVKNLLRYMPQHIKEHVGSISLDCWKTKHCCCNDELCCYSMCNCEYFENKKKEEETKLLD